GVDVAPLGDRAVAGVRSRNRIAADAPQSSHGGEKMAAAAVRRWRWVGVIVLLVVLTAGCNPLTLPFFVLCGLDPTIPPPLPLASDKKPIKVLVLTDRSNLEIRRELLGADRELTALVSKHLEEACKQNKENVTVIASSRLQHFKDEHPGWKSMMPEEIGKYFD